MRVGLGSHPKSHVFMLCACTQGKVIGCVSCLSEKINIPVAQFGLMLEHSSIMH